MPTLFKCPYCGTTKRSENGTGSDVSCCGERGHFLEVETTHSVFDVVIGILDSHGWEGRANDLRTIKTQIPDVPIYRGSPRD